MPSISGASFDVTNIAVGPSAPPIMAIEPACWGLKPSTIAITYATKIPSCAAAPNINEVGFAISELKSVIEPIPRKISGG